jgi:sulfatase maturation enzyme AslB (radical SAM superfamily)
LACIEKIYSVSALVGDNTCNANCSFCAARDLRKDATKHNQMPYTFKSALKLSARYGGWSLSLTSSGEPTCSPEAVTNALKDYQECAIQGAYYPNVNLFTNGILLANDSFCGEWLPYWKSLGLTAIAVSIHNIDEIGQAEAYGLLKYPSFKKIFDNIHKYDLQCRATLLLRKGAIDNNIKYEKAINCLISNGVHNISSWCIGNPDGTYNEYSPNFLDRLSIKLWLKRNAKLCHGHVWGGGIFDYKGNLIRLTDYVTKHNPHKDFVRQLVVFQDGLVAYSWIKEGAICLMP